MSRTERRRVMGGTWICAAALALYAVAFSFAYVSLEAGMGALLLFGAVQMTIILGAHRRGERVSTLEWLGRAVSFGGLVYLVSPGLSAPPLVAALLMVSAGIAWGIYTLQGRGTAPLQATAGNFARATPLVLGVSVGALMRGDVIHVTVEGIGLAAASGVFASGLGYVMWYAALRRLTAVRAAIVQLSTPVLVAAGGLAVLGDPLSVRLVASSALILGGIALALSARRQGVAEPSDR